MIYLDNNATTQIAPEAIESMLPYLSKFYGNPSSSHEFGRELRPILESAREAIAKMLGAAETNQIAFTSGGTESDNWALLGSLEANLTKTHIITTRVEHEAVRNLAEKLELNNYQVTWLDVDQNGELDLQRLRDTLGPKTALVSIMHTNNETGVEFPIKEIGEIVKTLSDAVFHVDGVSAVGKTPIDLSSTEVDLYSISGHKFYAPKGVGALYIRDSSRIAPVNVGGGQEGGRRAGTEAMHQIVGMGTAANMIREIDSKAMIGNMRDHLESFILANIPDTYVNGNRLKRACNTTNISFDQTNGESIVAALSNLGICVATGSACNEGKGNVSAVLSAMEVPYSQAMGSIRFSLGRYNTMQEIETVCQELPRIIEKIRNPSGER